MAAKSEKSVSSKDSNHSTELSYDPVALLLNQSPDESFFDAYDIQQKIVEFNDYNLHSPVTGLKSLMKKYNKEIVQLNCHIIKYTRKKNPNESRYAVCELYPLSSGLDGKVFKVIGTIILKKDQDGNPGIIYKRKNTPGKKRLVKRMLCSKYDDDLRTPEQKAEKEYKIGCELKATSSNPQMKIPVISKKQNNAALLIRYFEGGTLSQHFRNDKHGFYAAETTRGIPLFHRHKFSDTQRIEIAILIGEAIIELHKAKIIHRDIKPKNIIYNEARGTIKLIDFGFSEFKDNPSCNKEGTKKYASPEIFQRKATDEKSDAYSFARILERKIFVGLGDPYTSGKYASYTPLEECKIKKIISDGLIDTQEKRASLPEMIEVLKDILSEMKRKQMMKMQSQQPTFANSNNENNDDGGTCVLM